MFIEVPVWFEITSMVVLALILIADLTYIFRWPHVPSMREAALWVAGYAVLAIVFGGLLWALDGAEVANQFFAGWLTEYSLSIDNLFVFVIIMARFAVPKKIQQEVLMVGILMALVLRGIFILLGAALIANFSWIFFIFGAFLIYTAYHQAFRSEKDEEETEGRLIRFLRRRIKISPDYDGVKLRTSHDGKRVFTPVILVFLALAITDTIFAFDSIPAIFGITTNPFIVFAANIFALMGLRQLYFLLGGLLERMVYLKFGIAAILAFIGVKLIFHAMHVNSLPFINGGHPIEWAPEISTGASLLVIVCAMAVSIGASLIKLRRDKRAGKLSGADE